MDDLAITCYQIIESYDEETKVILTKVCLSNFSGKEATCKTQNFYMFPAFLLITVVLLMAISIYCYLKEYRAKQEHLSPFHNTESQNKSILIT